MRCGGGGVNKQNIEGMPKGFAPLRVGVPEIGEWYLNSSGPKQCKEKATRQWLILEKMDIPTEYRPFRCATEFEESGINFVRDRAMQRYLVASYTDGMVWLAWNREGMSWERAFNTFFQLNGECFGVKVEDV
jgi:hypothetical protein